MLYWKISNDQRVNLLSGPWPMLLYTWLIPCQDNLGRLEGDADIVRGMVFPKQRLVNEARVEAWLKELHDKGLLYRYHVNGAWYLQFPKESVKRHQKLVGNMSEESDFPSPDEYYHSWERDIRSSMNMYEQVQTCSLEGKGREEKGSRRESLLSDRLRTSFEQFWAVWPKNRRVGKSDALSEWKALNPSDEELRAILTAIERQKTTQQWQSEYGRFIPHPSRWLKKRRWEDEIDEPPSQSRRGADPDRAAALTRLEQPVDVS